MSFEDDFLDQLKEALSYEFEFDPIHLNILENAKCSFQERIYEDPDNPLTILHIKLPIEVLRRVKSDKYFKEIVLENSHMIFPKYRPMLWDVEFYGIDNHLVITSANNDSQPIHSIFGEPSTDPQFQCDIFVIMPFHDDFKWLYENVIEQVVKDINTSGHKLVVKRADNASKPSAEIMKKVWSMMNYCSLVIAICTPKDGDKDKFNPNVFYEVGIAHTIGKEVILVTDKSSELPFDIRHLEAVEYIDDKPANVDKLKRTLSEIITQHFKKT